MPIHKTEILGSIVEIAYEEGQKEKLLRIIENFKYRLSNFIELKGKVSDNKILILTALKSEDQIEDLKNKIHNNKKESLYENNLSKEIIKLKDKIAELSQDKISFEKINTKAIQELDLLENQLVSLENKIISTIDKNE